MNISNPRDARRGKTEVKGLAAGVVLSTGVVVSSLPASIYVAFYGFSGVVPRVLVNRFPSMALSVGDFIGWCWLLVILAGRPLAAIALVLDLFLVFWRGAPLPLKFLASAFLIVAVCGTLLIESQARAVTAPDVSMRHRRQFGL
jgi:hypothetical protein